jgi:phosphoribosylglycinamide formyltransferase-1
MTNTLTDDARLTRLTEICLALPEVTRSFGGQHAIFAVRDKKFAYYLNDHHGDGVVALCCKAPPGMNTAMIEAEPARFLMPAYLGPRGWVSLRLDLDDVDWDEVTELITDAYRLTAPKRLAASVGLSRPNQEEG